MKKLLIDEQLRDLFPPLSTEEFQMLETNIKRDGCTSPLFIWRGYIVDGHNRYKICTENSIEFQTIELAYQNKDEVIQWMIETQLGRRNLTSFQKILIAEKYRPIFEKKAKANQSMAGGYKNIKGCNDKVHIEKVDTRQSLANLAGISPNSYGKGAKIIKSDRSDIIEKLIAGKLSIDGAYRIVFKKNKARKPIPQTTVKHLINKTGGKCELCQWGGIGLEGILIPHHITKYADTDDNSIENLILICPNCHHTLHILESCKDKNMFDIITNNIPQSIRDDILYFAKKLNEFIYI